MLCTDPCTDLIPSTILVLFNFLPSKFTSPVLYVRCSELGPPLPNPMVNYIRETRLRLYIRILDMTCVVFPLDCLLMETRIGHPMRSWYVIIICLFLILTIFDLTRACFFWNKSNPKFKSSAFAGLAYTQACCHTCVPPNLPAQIIIGTISTVVGRFAHFDYAIILLAICKVPHSVKCVGLTFA